MISTRYNYAQNPAVEWLRTWRFAPGMQWRAHEPPLLVSRGSDGQLRDVAAIAPFTQAETEAAGAKFQHFSYGTEAQVRFKEIYYAQGHAGNWQRMNAELRRSKFLRDYFPWVTDLTMIDRAGRAGVLPWAEQRGRDWGFLSHEEIGLRRHEQQLAAPRIVLDTTFSQTAPAVVNDTWIALLREWWATGFCDHVVLLDRGGLTPRLEGLRYRSIPLKSADEPDLLQRVCEEMGATLFLSARNFAPRVTPSIMLHGLNGRAAAPAAGVTFFTHFVTSEREKRLLLAADPNVEPLRVITVGIGPGTAGAGVPTTEKALRDIAARIDLGRGWG